MFGGIFTLHFLHKTKLTFENLNEVLSETFIRFRKSARVCCYSYNFQNAGWHLYEKRYWLKRLGTNNFGTIFVVVVVVENNIMFQ